MAKGEVVNYQGLNQSYLLAGELTGRTSEEAAQMVIGTVKDALDRQDKQFERMYDGFDEAGRFSRIRIGEQTVAALVEERYKGQALKDDERERLSYLMIARAQMDGKPVRVSPAESNLDMAPVALQARGAEAPKLNGWQRFWSKRGFFKEKVAQIAEQEKRFQGRGEVFDRLDASTFFDRIKDQKVREDNVKFLDEQVTVYKNHFDKQASHDDQIEKMYLAEIGPWAFDPGKSNMKSREELTFFHLPEGGNFQVRSAGSLATLMMLEKGHSIEEIANPNFRQDRAEVGQELVALANAAANPDSRQHERAMKRIADIYMNGAELLMGQKMLTNEQMHNFTSLENPLEVRLRFATGYDIYQDISKEGINKNLLENRPRFQLVCDQMASFGRMGVGLALSEAEKTGLSPEFGENATQERLRDDTFALIFGAAANLETCKGGAKTIREYVNDNPEADARNSWIVAGRAELDEQLHGETGKPISFREMQQGKVAMLPLLQQSPLYVSLTSGSIEQARAKESVGLRDARITLAENLVKKLGVVPESSGEKFAALTSDMLKHQTFVAKTAALGVQEMSTISQNPKRLDGMLGQIKPPIAVNQGNKPLAPAHEAQAQKQVAKAPEKTAGKPPM